METLDKTIYFMCRHFEISLRKVLIIAEFKIGPEKEKLKFLANLYELLIQTIRGYEWILIQIYTNNYANGVYWCKSKKTFRRSKKKISSAISIQYAKFHLNLTSNCEPCLRSLIKAM